MAADLASARHVIDRLGYGPCPGDVERIAAMGIDRWIEQQLNPQAIALPADLTHRLAGFSTARLSPPQIFLDYGPPSVRTPGEGKLTPEQQKERNQRAQFVAQESVQLRLLRAVESPCRLQECLSDFWSNHFNVFLGKDLDRLWLGAYVEEAIRPHLFGRFRDLLGATAKHPAMQFYLDNWLNTAPGSPGARGQFEGLNENYAREVMELHTLGVGGGYSQADVVTLAKIFTGWTIGPLRQRGQQGRAFPPVLGGGLFRPAPPVQAEGRGVFAFDPDRHDTSDKVFLGHTIRGGGIEEGETALDLLAHSPATARHVSFKLAQHFLADDPDKKTVEAMTQSFLSTDGNLRAVVRTLVSSPAFRAPAGFGTKFKSPYRYVISAVRAAGLPVRNFRPIEGALNQLGERPYGCLTPDGYKDTQEAWLNPDAMVRRLSFAVALASGHLPLDADPEPRAPGPRIGAALGGVMAPSPLLPPPTRAAGPAVDSGVLLQTLATPLTPATTTAIDGAAPELKAAMVLGSPEFMRC